MPAPEPELVSSLLKDQLGRRLHDLRVSVTDRCNFRCSYCMPKSVFDRDYVFLPQSALLSFEEIHRLVRVFLTLGTEKVRITGGEPLLRKHLERLIEMLANLGTSSGKPLDLTLTTNGALLRKKARDLRDAGLSRLTVSLDAIDDRVFRKMNDVEFPVADVLLATHDVPITAEHVVAPAKEPLIEDRTKLFHDLVLEGLTWLP